MTYLSVCSGIEAASVAWHPLGWKPLAFSEIEPFPSAVLAHHWPDVPNLGDMTQFHDWPSIEPDLIVGGTPCQAFSVAGLRRGLEDPRGNLTIVFLGILARYRPRWVVWENVPGVLSDRTGAFGSFLGGLGELGYGFAYRVLDAQYFGVAQRRRRVFVVGHLGDWRRAAAVLFEPESLRGDSPPSREKGERVAGGFECGPSGVSLTDLSPTLDARCKDGPIRNQLGAGVITSTGEASEWPASVAPTLNAAFGDKQGLEDQNALNGAGLFVPSAFDWQSGGDMRGIDPRPTAQLQRGQVPEVVGFNMIPVAHALRGHSDYGVGLPSIRATGGDCAGGSEALITHAHRPQITAAVRRLTPRECERLQGFPDDHTLIPYRGKPADACPDGPRYKALGNSMAVPVMRWIGRRINSLSPSQPASADEDGGNGGPLGCGLVVT